MGWQLSKLSLAAFLVSACIVGFSLVIAHGADVFNLTGYDASDLEAYNQLDALNANALSVRTEATDVTTTEGVFNQFESLALGTYNAVKVGMQTYNIVEIMINAAINGMNLGPFGAVLIQTITGGLLVILVMGIIFYVIFKVLI